MKIAYFVMLFFSIAFIVAGVYLISFPAALITAGILTGMLAVLLILGG